jgi:hypothetical protein
MQIQMDTRNAVILAAFLVFSCFFTCYGFVCVFAARKAILLQARWSTLVTTESASDWRVILQYRIMGCVFVILGAFFVLVAVVKLAG